MNAAVALVVSSALPPPEKSSLRPSVGAVAGAHFVKVPCWFGAGAALRVARLKAVRHILVMDRGAVVGTTTVDLLADVPPGDPLARWMVPATSWVSPTSDLEDAWQLMAASPQECIPVVSGALLVGIATREEISRQRRIPAGC